MSFGKKIVASGRRPGHMPQTKPKNQYNKTRNRKRWRDVAKVFLINNGDVASVINSGFLMGKTNAKWFDH